MDAKELKEKIDSVVVRYNEKPNSEYNNIISLMNEVNDIIEKNGAFYNLKGGENPVIYDLFYLNSVLKWNQTYKHKVSLIDTYFKEDIYKVSMNQNIFNHLPKTKMINVSKLKFKSYEPTDKSIKDLMSDFCGTDELRLNLMGTNFNSLGIVSVDAYKMVFLSKKDDKYENDKTFCVSDECLKAEDKYRLRTGEDLLKDVKFPAWKQIVPKDISQKSSEFTFDVTALKVYLNLCFNLGLFDKYKGDTLNVTLKFTDSDSSLKTLPKEQMFTFNLKFLLECTQALIKLGVSKAKVNYSLPQESVIFTNAEDKEREFLSKNFVLLMPVLKNSRETEKLGNDNFYFDFISNSVVYGQKKYEFPLAIEDGVTIEANKFEQKEVKLEISLEELSNYPKLKDKLNKLSDNKLKKEVRGGCSTNYNLTSKSYNCEYYIYISEYEVNTETKVSIMTSYHIDILKGGFGEGHNALNQAQDKVLKYFGRIKDEPKKIEHTENDEDYDVRLDDNVTMLVESKVDESNIADNKKQKIKDFLYAILNKNKEFIVNGKNEIDKLIAWFSDLTSNPTSTKILFEIIREKQPKTQKAVDEFLRNYIGLGAKEKKWLTKNEVIDIVNRNIGEYVFISNSKRDWVAGRKSYPHEPTNLMYLVKIDGNNVLYKYENNPSTYQTHIDSIRDIVVEGKSSVNDKKLEGIVASLFEVKSVAPVKEEVKITKEIVKEKWGLPAKEKRDWLDSLNEKDYQFAVTEMANISVDAVSESKKETHIESKSEALKDIDTSNMNFAQIVYNSNPNKFKKFKDLEWFKLKPNQKLVVVINSNENRIIYEKIHNGLKYVNSFVTDKLMKDPNLIKEFGDRVSYVAFDIDTLKKNNRIGFGVDYEYFKIKGLLEDLNDYFEANKHKEEQLLKTKFPEDKRLIKGNDYYLWTKTRGDSSNPNNFHKYIYNGLLHNANKYAYGSENVYQFSNEHTSTHIAYEKMDNTFVNTEIYSVDDFEKWEKEYEEKNNPASKKQTPAESKSDLEYLNELLATSKDLLDLISDTGSKADIDFLKSKIEATENLISLLADDKFSKGGGVTYPDLSMQIPQVVNDSVVLDEFFIKKTKNTFKINDFYKKITSSDNAVKILREIWEADTINAYEQAYIMYLNKSNNLIGYYHHSTGGIDGTIMDVQMICGLAVKSLAKGVIIAHNHPSQNRQPSDADRQISQQLKTALKTFNITLLDSMIITDDSYLSFADEGLLS